MNAQEEAVSKWLEDRGLIQKIRKTNEKDPHKGQRCVPFYLNLTTLEEMPKEIIEYVIGMVSRPNEDPSLVLSEILEGKRKVILSWQTVRPTDLPTY